MTLAGTDCGPLWFADSGISLENGVYAAAVVPGSPAAKGGVPCRGRQDRGRKSWELFFPVLDSCLPVPTLVATTLTTPCVFLSKTCISHFF